MGSIEELQYSSEQEQEIREAYNMPQRASQGWHGLNQCILIFQARACNTLAFWRRRARRRIDTWHACQLHRLLWGHLSSQQCDGEIAIAFLIAHVSSHSHLRWCISSDRTSPMRLQERGASGCFSFSSGGTAGSENRSGNRSVCVPCHRRQSGPAACRGAVLTLVAPRTAQTPLRCRSSIVAAAAPTRSPQRRRRRRRRVIIAKPTQPPGH